LTLKLQKDFSFTKILKRKCKVGITTIMRRDCEKGKGKRKMKWLLAVDENRLSAEPRERKRERERSVREEGNATKEIWQNLWSYSAIFWMSNRVTSRSSKTRKAASLPPPHLLPHRSSSFLLRRFSSRLSFPSHSPLHQTALPDGTHFHREGVGKRTRAKEQGGHRGSESREKECVVTWQVGGRRCQRCQSGQRERKETFVREREGGKREEEKRRR
jgi:hypothetical protein